MRFVIGSDEIRPVVDRVAVKLRERGHEVKVIGPDAWGRVSLEVAREVAEKQADYGVVCCWTGTGASMAANKVRGVRAALCVDAPTAAGARKWNDANVLALSLRLLSEPVADEIIDAWLDTPYGGTEKESLDLIVREDRAPLKQP
jgi:ribose 5-phosphate isomerase B